MPGEKFLRLRIFLLSGSFASGGTKIALRDAGRIL